MEKTHSNELISNLELYNEGYIIHAKYTRNSDGKKWIIKLSHDLMDMILNHVKP